LLELQLASAGDSAPEIHRAALEAAAPRPGLTWLDVGCGRGALLRAIAERNDPARLAGLDVIDWLDEDLRGRVELTVGPAESALPGCGRFDRVLLVETLEHLEAPWSALRQAARAVAPGGRLIVTTPNIANLRHRLELALRGRLTAFRPDNTPHLTPVVPSVLTRVLADEGLVPAGPAYAGRDVIPLSRGVHWPRAVLQRAPDLTAVSVLVAADAPGKSG
jgi:SAM-dependent methyltransferase